MKIAEIGTYLKNILPEDLLHENLKYTPMLEDGLRFGNGNMEVRGVLVCWMATAEAIAYAVFKGCNMIICHEDLWYQSLGASPDVSVDWPANSRRRQLLADNGVAVYRCHSPLDVLYTVDAALEAVNLKIKSLYSEWIARVVMTEPVSLAELARRTGEAFGTEPQMIGDASRTVRSVGISLGGMSLSVNAFFNEWLLSQGAEAVITGEIDEYAMFWAEESGVDIIAAGHAAIENPGLRRFCMRLKSDYPQVPVYFYECRTPIRHAS